MPSFSIQKERHESAARPCEETTIHPEQPPDIGTAALSLARAPDAVLLPFLSGLRARRDDLARVLDGRSLRSEVVLVSAERRVVYRIVFTAAGHVELTGAYGFDPHLRFEGDAAQLLGVVLGAVSTFDAVYAGLLTLHAPPNELGHYPGVRRLLA